MSQFLKEINKIVNNVMQENATTGRGVVAFHDVKNNTADIILKHIYGEDVPLEKVPICINGSGFTPSLEPGANVLVSMPSGSIFDATIVGIYDDDYNMNVRSKQKHTRKGAFVPYQMSSRGDF